tara:strand:+ start:14650 stop:15432 length:783 start_codon:yes stop_codon:yes gene_type:complete
MSTDSIDKHRLWVTKDENSAILFRDYQYLKLFLNVGVRNSLYETYKPQIDLDIPRSFPHSKWLKHPASIDLIKRQLQIWCVYSPIGYFQGMLFILIPLCYRYKDLDHLSFFAFGKIIKLLRFVHKDIISVSQDERKDKKEVLHVLRVLYQCCPEVQRYSQDKLKQISLMIEYNIMFTLALNRCGTTLENTDIILDFFLEVLYDKKKFTMRLKTFSFSFLLCLIKGNMNILELTGFELDRNALKAITQSALSSGTLFKAFS